MSDLDPECPNPFYVAHGPPFIAQGVTDRCQRRRKGQKCKRGGSCNSAATVGEQWSPPTLTVGDKGIKCPSPSTPKASVTASPFATAMASLRWSATVSPWLLSHQPRVPGIAPRA